MKPTSTSLLIGIAAVLLLQGSLTAGIKWDSGHPILIQAGGHYGRIARIDKGTLISGYDFRRVIHVNLSRDEGNT